MNWQVYVHAALPKLANSRTLRQTHTHTATHNTRVLCTETTQQTEQTFKRTAEPNLCGSYRALFYSCELLHVEIQFLTDVVTQYADKGAHG